MSGIPYAPASSGGKVGFSMFYVIIGGAALLGAGVVPIAFAIAIRHYRRLPLPPRPGIPSRGAPGIGGKPQQEEPKLFDVYVKPGFDVGGARFQDILPMAVRIGDADVAGESRMASTPSTTVRVDWSPWSQGRGVEKPEAPAGEDPPTAYDIAVLIAMPTYHPRVVDHWEELDEYAIGTLKLSPINPPDDPIC